MTQSEDEYWRQGTEKIEHYFEMVNSIISLLPEPKQARVREMMDGPVGEQFMTAPASTRRMFHYAFPAGLVAHSLNVVKYAVKLADTLCPDRWPRWKVMFCALFHDLGKAGPPGKPYYIQTKDEWKRKKQEFYDVTRDEFIPNAEGSLFIFQLYGVVLDYEEMAAIRLNDGAGARGNEQWAFREPDLALVIHWADHWASNQEKAEAK